MQADDRIIEMISDMEKANQAKSSILKKDVEWNFCISLNASLKWISAGKKTSDSGSLRFYMKLSRVSPIRNDNDQRYVTCTKVNALKLMAFVFKY